VEGVSERLDALEQQSRDSAQLVQEIAREIHALALSQQVVARRARVAVILAGSAAAIAIIGLIAVLAL
jgi:hypothetical protein